MQRAEKVELGTPDINLYVRKCSKCNKHCYYYNDECFLCSEKKLR